VKLTEYIDGTKLRQYIDKRLVNERFHKRLPLAIYSYGKKAVYDNVWDDVTTRTRGLIVDMNTGDIVARPFEKFFAYNTPGIAETYDRNLEKLEQQVGPPVIQEKINGCLGTFWRYGIHWGVATKGSFHSEHAEWATRWMENHLEGMGRLVFPVSHTPVFEIICQDVQPHVIKYEKDELVLLALVNNENGSEIRPDAYANLNNLSYARESGLSLNEALKADSAFEEGYVATYRLVGKPPVKIKIKFPTFIRNRKLFYEEQEVAKVLNANIDNEQEYNRIFAICSGIVREGLVLTTTRAEMAKYLLAPERRQYAHICFTMLDQTGHHKALIEKVIKERQEENEAESIPSSTVCPEG
jgi:hypothetical protein